MEVQLIAKDPPFDSTLNKLLRECTGRGNVSWDTFSGMYNKYIRGIRKKFQATPEMFSLMYNSTLEDLRKSIWIFCKKSEVESIKKKFNVIEEIYL